MYLHGIESERLRFRKLQESDIEIWEKFFVNNSNLEYLGLDLSLDYQAQSKDWIERQLKRYIENRFGHHALIEKDTGEFIGQCGLLAQEIDGKTEFELGYHILPEHWGKGYATEAAKRVRDYAFENKICKSLISVVDVRNIKSQHVAKKLGMKAGRRMQLYGLEVILFRMDI
jgi:RimJ/RimL family protein N-acetyltransferase